MERELASRLRNAVTFCKQTLELTATNDRGLNADQRMGFEKCLTENYLVKYGSNYFGKRDLIYLDLYGTADVQALNTSVWYDIEQSSGYQRLDVFPNLT